MFKKRLTVTVNYPKFQRVRPVTALRLAAKTAAAADILGNQSPHMLTAILRI